MKISDFLVPVLLLATFALVSCQPQKDKSADTNNTASSSTATGTATPRYWRLVGTIGKYPVVMDLAFRPSGGDEFAYEGYHGSYYYESKEDLIDFYGNVDSTGQLVITEMSEDESSATFRGTFDPASGSYKGTWAGENSKRTLPFELREDYSGGAIQFTSQRFEESRPLFSGKSQGPSATISTVWISPAPGTDDAAAKFLEEAIRKGMLGDSLAALISTPDKAFAQSSETFFRMYREDMAEVKSEEIDSDSYVMFTYEQNSSVEVLYNRGNLLTLGFWDYWFTGGAHGNYATFLQAFDLQTKKEITLQDVFVPGYEKTIKPALEQAVRNRFGISKSEPIGSVLFDNDIATTENFGLTGKGVVFNYPPYEIAAYAAGEIRLFIPYSEILSLLQPEFAARFAAPKQ